MCLLQIKSAMKRFFSNGVKLSTFPLALKRSVW